MGLTTDASGALITGNAEMFRLRKTISVKGFGWIGRLYVQCAPLIRRSLLASTRGFRVQSQGRSLFQIHFDYI